MVDAWLMHIFKFWVSSFNFQFQVSSCNFQFQVSIFKFRVSSFSFPFQVSNDIDPILKTLKTYKTDLQDFRSTPFPNLSIISMFKVLNFPQKPIRNRFRNCSWIIWSGLVVPKLKIIGFGSHGHVRQVQKHENEGFLGFPIMNFKSY